MRDFTPIGGWGDLETGAPIITGHDHREDARGVEWVRYSESELKRRAVARAVLRNRTERTMRWDKKFKEGNAESRRAHRENLTTNCKPTTKKEI